MQNKSKKKITLLIFLLFFIVNTGISQKHVIKGKLIDNNRDPIIGAVAVLLHPQDSTMVAFAPSDQSGHFNLTIQNTGSFNLQITYIGFGTLQRRLSIDKEQKELDLGTIMMSPESQLLNTVVISEDYVPIIVKKDTLEFNAEAFKLQPNASVEELLKRLPGVEVENDGTIKVQGEEVKKITVDGKDFFGNDPKMATQNLPAEVVKKVQVFDKKSKNTEFTGVDDGQEEKTINLELKPDKRRGFFGNAMAGYGTDNRYQGSIVLNKFGNKTQATFISNANNLNNTSFESATGTSLNSASGRGRFGSPIASFEPGENTTVLTGINLNHTFRKNFNSNFNYALNYRDAEIYEAGTVNSFLPSGALLDLNVSNRTANRFSHTFNTLIEATVDSLTQLSLRGGATYGLNKTNNLGQDTTLTPERQILLINNQDKTSKNENWSFNFILDGRRKFVKFGRSLVFSTEASSNDVVNNERLLNSVLDRNMLLNLNTSVFQRQGSNSSNTNIRLSSTYTEPLNSNYFILLNAGWRNNNRDIDKSFFDIDPLIASDLGQFNEELSRIFDNTFNYFTVGSNLRNVTESYRWNIGADVQQSYLNGLSNVGAPINRQFFVVLPKMNFEWDKVNIRINYSTNFREPTIDQLQPVVDNSNPTNIYIGNPDLRPEYRHQSRFTYFKIDQFNFRSFFANVRWNYTDNKITTSTVLDPDLFIRVQKPVNTAYENQVFGTLNFSSPLNLLKSKYRLRVNSSIIDGINFLNGIETPIRRFSYGLGLMIENKNKSKWDASLSADIAQNNNIYKANKSLNTEFLNQSYVANVSVFLPKSFILQSKFSHYIFGQGSFGQATNFSLWEASVSKAFVNNKYTIKLTGFDLLSQNTGVRREASETFISEKVSNTIGRYVMLSLRYNINSFGAQAQENQRNMRSFH